MTISSRTPEGFPIRCVLCGTEARLIYSDPAGDAPCPKCGHLLWLSAEILDDLRTRYANRLGIPSHRLTPETFVSELAADSLDVVEMIMEFEDEYLVTIPDDDYAQIRTVGDAVRYIERWRREENP